MVLRDEVLETAEVGETDPPGSEIFDAIVRALSAGDPAGAGMDLVLHDAVSRRLAWGEGEDIVLAGTDQICQRLLSACQRAFHDPAAEMFVIEVATEVVCAASRLIAQAAISRVERERAAVLREELAQRRLEDALRRQREELAWLQGQK
jgi:hypothetical protein